MAPPTYGYLAVGRAHRDLLSLPDGTKLPPRKWDETSIYGWWQTNVQGPADLAYENSRTAWREQRGRFIGACRVAAFEGERRRDPPRIKEPMHRVTFPDGTVVEMRQDQSAGRIEEVFKTRYPEPTAPKAGPDYEAWRKAVDHQPLRTWVARLYLDGESNYLKFDPGDWSDGMPIQAILQQLNDLAHKGWTVMHVSEDRGLYVGEDTQNDAYVTRVRYMLVRS